MKADEYVTGCVQDHNSNQSDEHIFDICDECLLKDNPEHFERKIYKQCQLSPHLMDYYKKNPYISMDKDLQCSKCSLTINTN